MECRSYHWVVILWISLLQDGKEVLCRVAAEDVKSCPEQFRWEDRAIEFCDFIHGFNPSFYHCLHKQLGGYKEVCVEPITVNQGQYPMWSDASGGIYTQTCGYGTYQEAQLLSNRFYKCQKKSKCQRYGQISSFCPNGGTIGDQQCRCDYKNGYISSLYAIVNPLNQSCFKPKEQDDTCKCLNDCSNQTELNPAYKCVSKCPSGYHRPEMKFDCEKIIHVISVSSTSVSSIVSTTQRTTASQMKPNSNTDSGNNEKAPTDGQSILLAVGVGVGVLILIFISCIFARKNGCSCNIYFCCHKNTDIEQQNNQIGNNNEMILLNERKGSADESDTGENGQVTTPFIPPGNISEPPTSDLNSQNSHIEEITTHAAVTVNPEPVEDATEELGNCEPDNIKKAREKHYEIPKMLKEYLYLNRDRTESDPLHDFKLAAKGLGLPPQYVEDTQSNAADIFNALEKKKFISLGDYEKLFNIIGDQDTKLALRTIVDEIENLLRNGDSCDEQNDQV